MLTHPNEGGFTIVEVVIALLILSTAVLGLGTSASQLSTAAASAELRALALEAVEDRLTSVRLDPRYGPLDSLYAGVEQDILGITGMTRTTSVLHVSQSSPALDYKRITVRVVGPYLTEPLVRQIVKAAP